VSANSVKIQISVIPAQAGIQKLLIYWQFQTMDSRLRGNDELLEVRFSRFINF